VVSRNDKDFATSPCESPNHHPVQPDHLGNDVNKRNESTIWKSLVGCNHIKHVPKRAKVDVVCEETVAEVAGGRASGKQSGVSLGRLRVTLAVQLGSLGPVACSGADTGRIQPLEAPKDAHDLLFTLGPVRKAAFSKRAPKEVEALLV
jgi:hypothetical protein